MRRTVGEGGEESEIRDAGDSRNNGGNEQRDQSETDRGDRLSTRGPAVGWLDQDDRNYLAHTVIFLATRPRRSKAPSTQHVQPGPDGPAHTHTVQQPGLESKKINRVNHFQVSTCLPVRPIYGHLTSNQITNIATVACPRLA